MTIPNSGKARVAYAFIVAALAYCWQFVLYRPNGLVWALFLAAPLTPLLDRWLPGAKFRWRAA
jgi:enediyne biosynthesis protein E5